MPPLSTEQQKRAEHLMTESVGATIGIVLLAANDFTDAKANLLKAINEFPEEVRGMVTPAQRTMTLIENTKAARVALRELFQILALIDHEDAPTSPRDRGGLEDRLGSENLEESDAA